MCGGMLGGILYPIGPPKSGGGAGTKDSRGPMGTIPIGCPNVASLGLTMAVIPIIPFPLGDGIRLMELGSILSKFASASDCLRLADLDPEPDLVTRFEEVRDAGEMGVSTGEGSNSELVALSTVPAGQWHFCFFGMATLTPPHTHGFPGGQGQVLRGRPGFLTGTITRSL